MALRTEIEALRSKTREQATLIDRLQRRLGHGYALPTVAPTGPGNGRSGERRHERVRQDLSEAEAALSAVAVRRAAAGAADASRPVLSVRSAR